MAKIETYSLDEALTANDKLVGSSYQPGGSYVTASYTLGQVRDYMSTAVGDLQDRWSTISYKFSSEDVYDLVDPDSGVLELYSSEDNRVKWVILPGIPNKFLVISNAVYFLKKGTTNFNVNYNIYFASKRANDALAYEFGINTVDANFTEDYFKCASGGLFSGLEYKVGEPLLIDVYASEIATEGDDEFGIWIEYKYFDFNTDF